jgi:hypothetical protein
VVTFRRRAFFKSGAAPALSETESIMRLQQTQSARSAQIIVLPILLTTHCEQLAKRRQALASSALTRKTKAIRSMRHPHRAEITSNVHRNLASISLCNEPSPSAWPR